MTEPLDLPAGLSSAEARIRPDQRRPVRIFLRRLESYELLLYLGLRAEVDGVTAELLDEEIGAAVAVKVGWFRGARLSLSQTSFQQICESFSR